MSNFITFKGVGVRQFDVQQMSTVVSQSITPIGIKTPVAFGEGQQGLLAMHMTLVEQLQDNFKNLMLTNHGERLAFYDYGADLRPLVTEFSSQENFDSEAMTRINTAVSKYMPFIQLEGFKSDIDLSENGFIANAKIYVQYSCQRANLRTRTLELTIFAI
jgi:phage baseplate assembly protein W